MWVKKYVARTLSEAMAQVKADLGSEAVILHTTQVKVGGVFGLFGTRMIEVTAAADHSDRWKPGGIGERGASNAAAGRGTGTASARSLVAEPPAEAREVSQSVMAASVSSPSQKEPQKTPDGLDDVKSDVVSMKAMLHQVLDSLTAAEQGTLDAGLKTLYTALLGSGVQDELALSIVDRVRNRHPGRVLTSVEAMQTARELIQSDLGKVSTLELPVSGRRIVALVGPTGVGKTTTLAKLAAHYCLGRRLRVGLITSDTFRVAAVDQLRTYAEILGVPLEVVYDQEEMAAALERQRNRDLILVDTAGRSPRNDLHMQELQEYLQTLRPDEIYLVMSMTSSYRDARRIVESYLPMKFNRFIFTKWDEAAEPGLIYNVIYTYRISLSYITTGQNVPDDIETANSETITRAILGD